MTTISFALPNPITCSDGKYGYFICYKRDDGQVYDSLYLLYSPSNHIAKALTGGRLHDKEHYSERIFAESTIVEWAKELEKKVAERKAEAVAAVEAKFKEEMQQFQNSSAVFALALAKKNEEVQSLAKDKETFEEKLKQKEKEIADLEKKMKLALEEKDISMTNSLSALSAAKDAERETAVKTAIKVAAETLAQTKKE